MSGFITSQFNLGVGERLTTRSAEPTRSRAAAANVGGGGYKWMRKQLPHSLAALPGTIDAYRASTDA